MRGILTLLFVVICSLVSSAQDDKRIKVQFRLQSVSTTSGAGDCCFGNDPDFYWNIHLVNNTAPTSSYYHKVGETSSKFVYVGLDYLPANNITYAEFSERYVGTTTGGGEEDGGVNGGDDDACGSSGWAYHYFKDYQPGVTHTITQQCGHFYAYFTLRWDIEPTSRTITVKDNPISIPLTNYCEGKNVYVDLSGNNWDESLNTDYEYYWEYNYVGNSYPVYNCYVQYNGGGGPINFTQAQDYSAQIVPIGECEPSGFTDYCNGQPYDPACATCVCEVIGSEDTWSYLRTTPINEPAFNFPAFKTDEFNNVRLRVSIRKKTNATYSSPPRGNSNPTNFFVYDPPPILNNLPGTTDQLIESVSEVDYTSSSLDIHHVTCFGDATGSIKIKSVTGGGNYKFYLRETAGPGVWELAPSVAPSAAEPVIFSGLKSGLHTLIVENRLSPVESGDSYGVCYSTYSIYIKQPTDLTASFASIVKGNGNPHPISCSGQSDGQVTITPSGGVGSYDFAMPGFTSQNNQSGEVIFSGLGTGNYVVTTTDDLGCTQELNVGGLTTPEPIVIDSPTPDLFDGFPIQCNGSTAEVNVFVNAEDGLLRTATIQGVQKNIPDDVTAATYTLPEGTYQVTAAYSFGCAATPIEFTLTEPAPITASFVTAKPPSCLINKGPADSDGYLEITAGGGIAKSGEPYSINLVEKPTNTINGQTVRFENLAQGTYNVVVQDKYCTKTISSPAFVVPPNPAPVAFTADAAVVDPSCFEYTNGKITVAAKDGTPFSTNLYKFYLDNDLRSGTHASVEFSNAIGFPVGRGTHELKIEDSKGCFETRTVTVNEPLAINAFTTITQNICAGDAGAQIKADLQGGTGPYTVQWKNSSSTIIKNAQEVIATSVLDNRLEGTYILEVKDAKGCSNKIEGTTGEWFEVEKQVTDPLPLVPTVFSKEDVACFEGTNGYVSLNASGGWSNYRYSIDNVNFKVSNEFNNLNAGLYTFYVRDNRGCVRSLSQTIEEPALLEASLQSITDAKCFESATGAVQVQVQGGTAPYYTRKSVTDTWQEGNIVNNLEAGNYTIFIKDENNCPQSVQAVVQEPTKLTLTGIKNTNSTCGSANGEGEVIASGGTGPYTYQWFTSANTFVQTGSVATNLVADVYRVEVADKNQCVTPASVEISDIGGAKISATNVTGATCSYSSDGAINLTVTEGTLPYQFDWSNQAITKDIALLSAGEYRVGITDANGCKLFRTITVGAPPPLQVEVLNSRLPNCFGDANGMLEVSFTGGNGGYTYQWSNSATATLLDNITAGTYSITLNDSKGCVLNENIVLDNPPKFEINIDDKTICVGQTYTVDVGVENATYQWTSAKGFSSAARNVTLTEAGTYQVQVIDNKGCPAQDSFILTTSSDLLKAEFLVAKQAFAGDTVVIIDISWPMPDGVTWQFDSNTSEVIYQGSDYAEIIFDNPGVYEIEMSASLGDCRDVDVQFITIEEGVDKETARAANDSYIGKFDIYPNPTDGDFAIDVELAENAPEARLRIINLSSNKVFLHKDFAERKYVYDASLQRMPGGVYYVLLEVGEEKKLKRIVIR